MMFLRQSTAATVKLGPFLDETDGRTAETGLTLSQADIRLSKNGGDIAQSNNAAGATHDELGYYDVPLDTTDTGTLGRLKVMVHESGALPVWAEFTVLPANVYDSLIAGSDKLQADVAEFGGATLTAAGGRPEVNVSHLGGSAIDQTGGLINANVKQISGDATAADNAEAAFDGTGYNVGAGSIVAASVTSFGTLVADIATAVWGAASRTLTAISDSAGITTLLSRLTAGRATNLDNLDAAVSTRLATAGYTAPLDAAGTRTAVGLASANLDTQLTGINTNVDAAETAIVAALPGEPPTANENADALLDRASAIDGYTVRQLLRLVGAALVGEVSGAGTTTVVFRAADDSKARITATVDADGNRTALTLDAS